MKASSIQTLEKYKHHWQTLKTAGYVNHLDHPTKIEIQSVIQEEQDQHYHENLWCGECLINMFKRAYRLYEQHLEALAEAADQAARAASDLNDALQISADFSSTESTTVITEITVDTVTQAKAPAADPATAKKTTSKKKTSSKK